MATVTYYDLGHNRPLHQLVFAGTHDAGITTGAQNAQTQNLNIYKQAKAGARIFDLRVAAHVVGKSGGRNVVRMQTFHADPKLMVSRKGTAINQRTDQASKIKRTHLLAGEWGLSLEDVLKQALNFVSKYKTEFLLLKFDKCKNYNLIAEACVTILNDVMLKSHGNLNTRTLYELRGKVIPMFPKKDYVTLSYDNSHGIFAWKNLKSEDDPGSAYESAFPGLQYFGGGGTNALNGASTDNKITENERKQRKKMSKIASAGVPEVLGMMYWTTTGLKASILDRDKVQWNAANSGRLAQMWEDCLGESIQTRLPMAIVPTSYSAAGLLKTFMPNFVMVDFIDESKGNFIKDLNTIAATQLTKQMVQQPAWDLVLETMYH